MLLLLLVLEALYQLMLHGNTTQPIMSKAQVRTGLSVIIFLPSFILADLELNSIFELLEREKCGNDVTFLL